jgi:hypothetical protein
MHGEQIPSRKAEKI